MRKTFCDRCDNEKDEGEVGHDREISKELTKSDGSRGPRLRLTIDILNLESDGESPDFCVHCFEEVVMDFLAGAPKKEEEPKVPTVGSEEDIPF